MRKTGGGSAEAGGTARRFQAPAGMKKAKGGAAKSGVAGCLSCGPQFVRGGCRQQQRCRAFCKLRWAHLEVCIDHGITSPPLCQS